ncbi:MAG: hypothetical protein ACI4CS_09775 [Candidatus Weimeria sp.]
MSEEKKQTKGTENREDNGTKAEEKADTKADTGTGTKPEEAEKPKPKKLKKRHQEKPDLKSLIAPVCTGIIIAVCVLTVSSMNGQKLKGCEGSYTVYLNDGSLSKIGSYTFTSVKQKGAAITYEGSGDEGSTTVIAKDGTITIVTPSQADSYTDAFVLKDE